MDLTWNKENQSIPKNDKNSRIAKDLPPTLKTPYCDF
jgi:hypothetical protein